MSRSNTAENDVLLLEFNNTNTANIGDATGLRGSTTAGSFPVALHTAAPGEAGNGTTSEAAYTGYARVTVLRASGAGGWTVTNNSVVNASAITFPQNTGVSETVRFWSITRASGASVIQYWGHLGTAPIAFTAVASTDVVTAPGHALADTNEVVVYARPGATLPTGLTEGTVYFVRDMTGDTFKLAATSGGTAIDLTAVGAGVIGKVTKLDVSNLVSPEFAASQLTITVD